MEPKEIFELIIKADEKLKYAHEDNRGLRKQQARALLVQAREAAVEIGNDALVQQADTRLTDLGGTDQPGKRVASQSRNASRRAARVSAPICSSVSMPVSRIVIRNCSRYVVHPSHPEMCSSNRARSSAGIEPSR